MSLFIPIILGTTRQGNQSRAVANYVLKTIQEKLPNTLETELIDVSTLDLSGGEDGDLQTTNQNFISTIKRADGYIIISPEYNHSFPGSLKSALDICYDEYNNKAVGFVGVSSGSVGGARMIEHLVGVVKTLGLKCVKKDVLVGPVSNVFNNNGEAQDPKLEEKIVSLGTNVAWLAKALKDARTNSA